jgi:hypothetical protein
MGGFTAGMINLKKFILLKILFLSLKVTPTE